MQPLYIGLIVCLSSAFGLVSPGWANQSKNVSSPKSLYAKQTNTTKMSSVLNIQAWLKSKGLRRCRRQKRRGRRLPGSYRVGQPFPRKWWSYCKWWGIANKRCETLHKNPTAKEVHATVLDMLEWLKRDLKKTSNRACRVIKKQRRYYFAVRKPRRIARRYRYNSRPWWWDRTRKKNKQYMMVDAADRMVRSVLSSYPKSLYHQLIKRWMAHLYHRALPMGTETAMTSRVSRWMNIRPAPAAAQKLAHRMTTLMIKNKACPLWYVIFMGNFTPKHLIKISPKMSRRWCELKNIYRRLAFATFPQLERKMKRWARDKRFRKVYKLKRIGCSSEGRAIWAYRLGLASSKKRPAAVLVGNQHGDEHMGADLTTMWTQELLKRYLRGNKRVRRWFRTRHIWIIPVLNPDGKTFDLLGGMIKWWRYNRGIYHDGQIGADLNRNFSYKWRRFRYRRRGPFNLPGTHPFSEPETNSLRRFMQKLRKTNKVTALLDIHQSGSVLLMPYAHKWKRMPKAYSKWHKRIGKYLTAKNRYRVWRARRLYPHYGTLGDWAFSRFKALSFVLELGRTRYLTRRGMKKVYKENRLLLNRFANLATNPYRQIDRIWRRLNLRRSKRKNKQLGANH